MAGQMPPPDVVVAAAKVEEEQRRVSEGEFAKMSAAERLDYVRRFAQPPLSDGKR